MNLNIVEIHPAADKGALNTEWFTIENAGEASFSTKACAIAVSRGGSKRRKELGTMDPGITLAPKERVRVITGKPGKKAHGTAPDDDVRNYNLFLGAAVFVGPGTVLHFGLRSHPLAKAVFDPASDNGIAQSESN